MRLNRYLAAAGLGSRRSVEELITTGRVKINGRVVVDLGTVVGERIP
jgi:16S rRNA U516 pseudouridylate synthase RsuA-like enzyme